MRIKLLIIPVIFLLIACGKTATKPAPVKALLTFPDQNSICITGTNVTATQSSVTFTWNPSANTNSYNLVIKNLLTTASTTQNTTQAQASVTLLTNTPYSWYVVSTSTQTTETAQSDTWKFYNAGPGIVTYAPFPADITAPTFGQQVTATTGTINLTWTGSAVAPDVVANYDVYFGTTTSPAKLASAITNSFLNNVNVVSKTTYYWHIITRDAAGNTSDSGLYQFSVN
jgi:hypothetical protein